MTSRLDMLIDFARRSGITSESISLYKQDGGARRYFSVGSDGTRLLVDAPPSSENTAQFVLINELLDDAGITVPKIYEADKEKGLLLIEKLGDTHLGTITRQSERLDAYRTALQIAKQLEKLGTTRDTKVPVWDDTHIVDDCTNEFMGWWWPETFGTAPSDSLRGELRDILRRLMINRPLQSTALVHRDFFSNNLMWLPERDGIRRVAVIDHQSAGLGPTGYDAVSLIQDARCAVPRADELAILYSGLFPRNSPIEILTLLDTFALLRHLRIVGVWARIAKRGRIVPFASFAPRTWGLLNAALQTHAGAELREWFDEHVPRSKRGQPYHLSEAFASSSAVGHSA